MPNSNPDARNGLKQLIFDLYVRVDKARGPIMLGLLAGNQAILIYNLIAWRGVSLYLAVPAILTLLAIAVVLFARFWIDVLSTYKNQVRAETALNPKQIYQIPPFQEMAWRHLHIPRMRSHARLLHHAGESYLSEEVDREADRLNRWVDLGYIPRDDFPEHLLHHYLADEGERL
jgi:hypothetical protein